MDVNCESVLAERARQGSEEAWRLLFAAHFRAVYGFCLLSAGGRGEEAEEIAQQVFVTAARKIDRFDGRKGSFRQWLLGIARHCGRKHFEKRGRQRLREGGGGLEAVAKPEREETETMRVMETLAQLPETYRAVLESKYLERRPVSEIAERRQTTVKAVESMLTRARNEFRRVYERLGRKEFEA